MSAPVQSCQPSIGPLPYTYGYVYADKCIRFNGGAEVNGGKPTHVVALYDDKAIATLKARAEQAEHAVDILESNAREQAKLLADTGRRVEEMEGALRKIANAPDGQKSFGDIGIIAINVAKAALSSGEAVE